MRAADAAVLALLVATAALAGCSGKPTVVTAAALASARTQIVARINRLRARRSLTPLAAWTAEVACANDQARADATARTPHSAFGTCHEMAQNECPEWPALDLVATSCLTKMWAEGPGSGNAHGHYRTLANRDYTRVAVGFYVTPHNTVWTVLDFR